MRERETAMNFENVNNTISNWIAKNNKRKIGKNKTFLEKIERLFNGRKLNKKKKLRQIYEYEKKTCFNEQICRKYFKKMFVNGVKYKENSN